MRTKKIALAVLLTFLSIILSATLGQLDFLRIAEGNLRSGVILILISVVLAYLIAIVVFILDFSDKKNLVKTYYVISLIFGLVLHLVNPIPLFTVIATLSFFGFLFYLYRATLSRSKLFVKFKPNEIFVPVVRYGLLFLLGMFALLGFFQTKSLMNGGRITPQLVKIVSRPILVIVNRQLGAQLQAQLGDKFEASIGTQDREKIVKFVLAELVESMSEGETRQLFGFRTDNIPIDKTLVYPSGEIDITPVVDAMLPDIAEKLNARYGNLMFLAPFVVAFFIVLFLQPLFIPFHILSSLFFIPMIFSLLIHSGFTLITKEAIEVERLSL